MSGSCYKKYALISFIMGIGLVILLNIYIFFIERHLPVGIANLISNIYFIPFFMGSWISGNAHQPSGWGFNLTIFFIGFAVSFWVVLLLRKIRGPKH